MSGCYTNHKIQCYLTQPVMFQISGVWTPLTLQGTKLWKNITDLMKTFILCITLFSISLRCICNKYMHLFDSYLLFQFCLEPLISDSVNSSHSRLLSIPLIKLILFADVILTALRTSCISGYSFTLLSPHMCTHTCAHIRVRVWTTYFSYKHYFMCFSRKYSLWPLFLYQISLELCFPLCVHTTLSSTIYNHDEIISRSWF